MGISLWYGYAKHYLKGAWGDEEAVTDDV